MEETRKLSIQMSHKPYIPNIYYIIINYYKLYNLIMQIVIKNNIKNLLWYKTLGKTKQTQINEQLLQLNKQLHLAVC